MKNIINKEKGSVLITLIIVMTVTAALGAGMVYFTSSSSLSELFSNQEARAYYIAEGGGRYAFSLLKGNSAYFDAYAQGSPYNQTFTLSNGDQFRLVVYQHPSIAGNVIIQSTGLVNAGLWTRSRRLITWNMAKSSMGGGNNPPPVNLSDFLDNQPKNGTAGDYSVVNVDGSSALKVDENKHGNPEEAYIAMPAWAESLNPFYNAWNAAGGFLSYDSQVKLAIGDNSGTPFTYRPAQYCMGITTQHHRTTSAQQHYFYSLSVVRTYGGSGRGDNIPNSLIEGTGVANNTPMIMLWVRNQNQSDHWLAFQQISTSDYILSESYFFFSHWPSIKPWTTLYLRVVEAASIKLTRNDAPLISVGAIINGATGTGKVIKKIQDSDVNGNVVLLLNNIEGNFTRPLAVSGYETDSTWGYRSKDNYIWAFYGDVSAHGTSNSTPLDNNRLANPRNGSLAWADTYMADWNALNDHFRLVQWNPNLLNTSSYGDPQVRLMGKDKEFNAIIRTNKIVTANTYASQSDFPAMLGLVCLGDACDGEQLEIGWSTGYYDDLAYLTGTGSGNPSGVQY